MSASLSRCYLDAYKENISPKLAEIDIMIKTAKGALSIEQVSQTLRLDESEIRQIMRRNGISRISKNAFFVIMQNGTSDICRLYRREVESGSPYTYTAGEIAYIYELDEAQVKAACDSLGIVEATAFTLPLLFSQILIKA